MNILVTGSKGQLGNQFKEVAKFFKGTKFLFANQYELDITIPGVVESLVRSDNIDCIINCAAYTGVDLAEDYPGEAMKVNALGVKNLAVSAAKTNTFIVHFSTDYVFDGKKNQPYSETDVPGPESAYGKSKLEGEKELLAGGCKGLIIRTSWLYSTFGSNFVKTIYEKGKQKKELKVVYDQVGSPTNAYDLACATLKILPGAMKSSQGMDIYNYSNEGVASWYDIAIAIFDLKKISCKVEPVLSTEFPSKAIRPHFSLLNKSKIKDNFQVKIPHWIHSLEGCLKRFK